MRDTYPQLEDEFVKTGKIRYAVLDFPLRSHPNAFKASEAAACAMDSGKFWEMHDLLFDNQRALGADLLPGYAETLGIDKVEFEGCLETGKKDRINRDLADARKAGISATPSFLIGWIQESGEVKILQQLRGAQPYENFERILNQLLAKGPGEPAKEPAKEAAR